jgi:predicted transcriptional regulator
MPTTVHVPDRLLAAVGRRARAMGISRNRFIVQALEREIHNPSAWSDGFLDDLRRVEPGLGDAVDEMVDAIRAHRRSKQPQAL